MRKPTVEFSLMFASQNNQNQNSRIHGMHPSSDARGNVALNGNGTVTVSSRGDEGPNDNVVGQLRYTSALQ